MVKKIHSGLLEHIRRLADCEASDGELLRRFTSWRDEAAFALLVQRHGAMVLGISRRVLGNAPDADDAFQAIFLILLRRAATLDSCGTVGNWLYTVAYRVALRARANAARRCHQEKQAMRAPRASTDDCDGELRQVLDEELARLPEKYRAPIVLCYLEGKTNEEAACLLGWTKGTVSGRLARARALLQQRLARRQLLFSVAALGVLTAESELPAALARQALHNAVLCTSGKTIAAPVAALVEGGIQAMAMNKGKLAVLVLIAALASGGSGWLGHQVGAFGTSVGEATLLAREPSANPRPDGRTGQMFRPDDLFEPEANRVEPYDDENRIAIQFDGDTQRFDISCLRLKDPFRPKQPKLLVQDVRGRTSNTCIQIDGADHLYGEEIGEKGVRWAVKGTPMKEVKGGKRRWYSAMDFTTDHVWIVQAVEIVVGAQTRLYDTVLVKYVLWNRDSKAHTVGVRAMLDTYIGANDGVPFFIPPTEDAPARFVDTKETLAKKKIPAFIRAIESDNKDGMVVELGLSLQNVEPIDRLVICRWPEKNGGGKAGWEWQFEAMNEPAGEKKDSCVVLYWSKIDMQPGEKRTCAFSYGLGRVSQARPLK